MVLLLFSFFCHPLLHVYTDLLAVDCSCCLIFGRQAWDALPFQGRAESLWASVSMDWKSCFFFQALFIFFCCGSEKLFFRLYLPFFCLLQILLSFITMFGLLYGFIVFIVLFEERCFVVYKRIGVWVPEADKCLDEVVDRHSLQI